VNKQEFGVFAAAVRTYYPKEQILPNQQAMELWYRELQDIPFNVAEATLRQWVATNKWSPSIADIREGAATVVYGSIKEWGEAWEEVLTSVRRFGLYNQEKALNSLDQMTRTAAERTGFRNICLSENIATERANFRMIYESLQMREKTNQQIALPLQEIVKQIQSENGMLRLCGGVEE
jgi:hypothetical protein